MKKIDWTKEKENLESYFKQGLQFIEIAKLYKSSEKTIKKYAIKLGIIDLYKPIFKCKYCGKEFDTKQKLAGHVNMCIMNPNHKEHILQLKNARKNINYTNIFPQSDLICKFCGKITHNKGALSVHEKTCELNPNKEKCPNRKGNGGLNAGHIAWNKGKTALTDERILKSALNRRKNIESGLIVFKGTPHNENTKRILREKMIQYIKDTGNGEFGQHYSKKACEYIDVLNKTMGWNLIHALNGGEKQVCGYFLDGYDEELNIAFEYDEPRHYENVYENKLSERDIKRQEEIIKELNCIFYRYNEKLDLFYKI